MYIDDEIIGKAVVLHLEGKILGGDDVDLFNGRLFRYIDSGRKSIILDLEKVERISSVGLGMLLSAMNSISRSGGRLLVANIPKRIESLLILTKLITVLNAKDSIEDALEASAA